jgi:hypothetical protein
MPTHRELEKQIWGRASLGAPVDTLPAIGPSPFRQPMAWLKQALGLQSGEPPQALNTSQILSAMDVTQGGWPFAKYEGIEMIVAGPVVGAWQINMIPADATSQFVIQGLSIAGVATGVGIVGAPASIGGAGYPSVPAFGQPATTPPFTLGNPQARLFQFNIAPGGIATTVDLLGARVVVIPPGFTLALAFSTGIAGGSQVAVDCAWARVPAGFKVA